MFFPLTVNESPLGLKYRSLVEILLFWVKKFNEKVEESPLKRMSGRESYV